MDGLKYTYMLECWVGGDDFLSKNIEGTTSPSPPGSPPMVGRKGLREGRVVKEEEEKKKREGKGRGERKEGGK